MRTKKYSLFSIYFFIAIVFSAFTVSCEKGPEDVAVTTVTLSQTTAEMLIGETVQLQVSITPSNATDKSVIWASSKQSVATISNSGVVTAVSEGNSTITASCGGKSATCQVIVSKGFVAVTSIELNKADLTLEKGKTETLTATISPTDATYKTLTWSSSNKDIASVDSKGKITAVGGGSAIITAKAGSQQATCNVTVVVPVESISLDRESVTLEEESTTTLVATIKPDDATEKAITWTTSDEQIAIVDNGLVTAKKKGCTIITAKVGDKEAACTVTVEASRLIVFADIAAKYACVAKYDTDGDGEVSIKEAEAATSFHDLFTNWRSVKSFDEIIFFKNVHDLGGAFLNCDQLVSITVPENITDLGNYAFSGCSSLTSVLLPAGITAIGISSFQNCTSLGSIDIPAKVTSIGNFAFIGCSSLSQIVLPESVTTLGTEAFSGCSNLSMVNIPSGITSIPAGCFKNCYSLASISVPESVTSIGDYAFRGVNMWKIELPSIITSLGKACFSGVICIIMPSTSPVVIQPNTFDGVNGIFVPSNLIDIYRLMTNWVNYASMLHPINNYKEKNEYTLVTNGAVDMGTSVKWAAYNLGANRPEEFGDYYAWGETQTKDSYYWDTYKWCNGRGNSLTKYCPVGIMSFWGGDGEPDGKTILELEDDAARANWGEAWRIPTFDEWRELSESCIWEWTWYEYEEICGIKVYGIETGNILFLPAASNKGGTPSFVAGPYGVYWSSSLYTDSPNRARDIIFDCNGAEFRQHERFYGFSIRPVTK